MACQLAKSGEIQAIVTAPVSKEVLNNSGYKFLGQTEILEHFLGQNNEKAEMLFISGDLKVMLLTRHLALKDVPSALSEEIVIENQTHAKHSHIIPDSTYIDGVLVDEILSYASPYV